MNFPARSIRIFENRCTGGGEIVNLVEKCLIMNGITVYSVPVQRICIEVSMKIRYVMFSHQWISTTSTNFTISPPPVKRFAKIRMLRAGEFMLSALVEHRYDALLSQCCIPAVSILNLHPMSTQIREGAHVLCKH